MNSNPGASRRQTKSEIPKFDSAHKAILLKRAQSTATHHPKNQLATQPAVLRSGYELTCHAPRPINSHSQVIILTACRAWICSQPDKEPRADSGWEGRVRKYLIGAITIEQVNANPECVSATLSRDPIDATVSPEYHRPQTQKEFTSGRNAWQPASSQRCDFQGDLCETKERCSVTVRDTVSHTFFP